MCGIAGFIRFSGHNEESDQARLDGMVRTLLHRGPDEDGMAMQDGVAMGMRRLSIIDLAGGTQPIYNEDKTVWTVYNGEIYNFPELKKELARRGHRFATNTDTEVIVHGYEEFGSAFVTRLNGMFGIALHDSRNHRFILARDHIGIKPLYYFFSGRHLVFGSEIKALLASGLVDPALDMEGLAAFLSWEYVPGEGTLLQGIHKLLPGQMLSLDLEKPTCSPETFWDIPGPSGEDAHLTDQEWEEQVLAQIRKSTRMQMISDVPLGAFLSGGVDSSLIAATMGEARTFSIGFDDPTYNELGWARKVADHLGVDHRDEIIRPDVVQLFEKLMHFMDDPIGDFSIFPTYLVSRLARKHVTVALSGDGGDELFGGYETYLAQDKARIYARIPSFIRSGLLEPAIHSLRPSSKKKGLVNKARRFVEGAAFPVEMAHARWRIFVGDRMRSRMFSDEALENIQKPAAAHITDLFQRAGNRGDLDRGLYVDVKSYLCDNILTKVDRMSMAVSLETRVPYLDTDLVELAFRVPERLKLQGNETKVILKRLAARFVPRECVYRPKEGFSIPIKHWLNNEFRPLLEEHLNEDTIRRQGIFRWKTIDRLKREHQAGKENHSHILWSLIVFHDWQNRWLKNHASGR
jgi:asparagine synthase (glutamine-hydrolysing)